MKNLKQFLSLFVIISMIAILSSCSKENSLKNMVPKTSSLVLVIDGKLMAEKSGIDNFTQTKSFQKALSTLSGKELESFKKFEQIFKDTKESGLNLQSEMLMFVNATEKTGKQAAFVLNISDKAKFEKFLTSVSKEAGEEFKILTGEGLSYVENKDEYSEKPLIAWNDKAVILMTCDKKELLTIKTIATIFNQKKEESITESEEFNTFYKRKKDISCFIEYDALMNLVNPMYSTILKSQMNMNMEGTTAELHLSFEKGKVVAEVFQHQGKEMEKMMKEYKLMNEKFDADILKILPQKSYANFSFSFNMLEYYKLMKKMYGSNPLMNIDQIEQMAQATLGMSIEDALKTFHGEFVMNIHDVKLVESKNPALSYDKTAIPTVKNVIPMFSVLVKMNNASAFDKLMTLYGAGFVKKENYYVIDKITESPMYLGLLNNILFFTNDEAIIKNATAGKVDGKSLLESPVAENLKKFPAYANMIFDMDQYPADVINYLKESAGEKAFPAIEGMMKNYKSIEFKPIDGTHSTIELLLKDDSKNSLNIILNSFDQNIDILTEL